VATTFVQVCNMALSRLGEDLISDLDSEDTTETRCREVYPQVVDEVLSAYNWACARSQILLSADGTTPAAKWDYRYAMPTNPYCLRIHAVKDLDENDIEYEVMGRYILCDEEDGIILEYGCRLVLPATFDSILSQAISLRIAWWIEPLFGDSVTRRKSIADEYSGLIMKARIEGALQGWADDETNRSPDGDNADWINAGR
jgi:hypothetical protein